LPSLSPMTRRRRSWHNLALTAGALQFIAACHEQSGADDSCKLECPWVTEADPDPCRQKPLADVPDFEATLSEWQRTCSPASTSAFPFLVEASCAEGQRFLYTGAGLSVETRYFGDDGRFLALEYATDVSPGANCLRRSAYWPERIPCTNPEVVRVMCGTLYEVGERIPL
jgi:hypothetical protein